MFIIFFKEEFFKFIKQCSIIRKSGSNEEYNNENILRSSKYIFLYVEYKCIFYKSKK